MNDNLALCGLDWADSPNIVPPLVVGIGSVLVPWLVMRPAFGAGIPGRQDPHPPGRLRKLGTHTVSRPRNYVVARPSRSFRGPRPAL